MYRDQKVGLVIPCRNEERLLPETLKAVPAFVDAVYVVDDGSSDATCDKVSEFSKRDPRVVLIRHESNRGPGAAVATGYIRSIKEECDLIGVVGGDNQMDLSEFTRFLDPLVDGKADYTKGNRFLMIDETILTMPRIRFIGNMIISALTKIASGYFKIADVVDGYTAITRSAASRVRWDRVWPGYGYPMDFLVRLNAAGIRVRDIPRRPVYLPGERQSQIKGVSYALNVSPMLLRDFFWRLGEKYIVRDFHPLIFFYLLGLVLLPFGILLGASLLYLNFTGGHVSGPKSILCALSLIMGFQSLIFAMLFDMQTSDPS